MKLYPECHPSTPTLSQLMDRPCKCRILHPSIHSPFLPYSSCERCRPRPSRSVCRCRRRLRLALLRDCLLRPPPPPPLQSRLLRILLSDLNHDSTTTMMTLLMASERMATFRREGCRPTSYSAVVSSPSRVAALDSNGK